MGEGIYQQAGDDAIQIGRARDVYIWTAVTAPTRPEFKRYLRMLAVVSAPMVGLREADPPPAPLDLWAEWRRLEEAVRNAWDVVQGRGAPWAVVRLNPPTRHALADALAAGDPESAYQVVHFSCHGAPNGLAFEDELGRTDFVTSNELVALFRDRPARLMVLNACQTEAIARRLHEEAGVPAVIATTEGLRDDEAGLLTARLYAWLARGRSVAEAFAEARSALRHAYERGQLPVPPDQAAGHTGAYIASRLNILILLGDARLDLPPEEERAKEPLITLAEPPSRGMELRLVESFIGRGPELVQVARWLRDRPSPVIALCGLGGIGKSALAAMAVLRGAWRFRAVVVLSARGDPHLRPDALVPPLDGVLGRGGELAAAPTEAERLERAIEALNQTPTLLVLDNLEDLSEAATRAWADFLGRLDPRRGSVALLTLRPAVKHPLTDLAGPAHLSLARLGEPDALRLLANGLTARSLWAKVPPVDKLTLAQRGRLESLARRAYLTWLPLGHLAALDDLVGRAGRHPLALRLALGDLGYSHVDWAKALDNLSDLRGRDWEAQAEAMVSRMVADLAQADPEAVALLQALLVFQGGATYEALRAVAAPEADEIAFDDHLRAALDASLLEARGSADAVRYDLHPLPRAYLNRQRLPAPETLTELHRSHAVYLEGWAWQHKWDFDALEAELPNLRAGFAFATAEATRDEAMVRGYGGALFDMFQTRGYWDDVLAWMGEAARACERLDDQETLSICYNNIAGVHWDRGSYREALEWLEKTVAIDQARGDTAGLGSAYNAMGVIYSNLGEMEQAMDWLNRSLFLLEEAGDRGKLATTWANIGSIHRIRGDYKAAIRWFSKAVPVLEEIGHRVDLATVYNNIGEVHRARGEYKAALVMYQKALVLREELGDLAGIAVSQASIGVIHHARGEYGAALAMFQKAAPVLEEIGDRVELARVYNNIGLIHHARGEYDAALEMLEKAAPVLEEIGDRATLAKVYNNIGGIHHARGEYGAALEMYQKAAPVLEEIGDRATLATVYNNIGEVHRARGEYGAALGMYQKAAPVLEEIGDRAMLATVEATLGVLYLQLNDDAQAEAHLHRSVALFDELGLETDDAQTTREVLQIGLEQGWDVVRQLLLFLQQNKEPL